MDAITVGYIVTGVIGFIILTSMFWGMKRGLKKSAFRFLWLLGFTIVIFFVTPMISNWLNNVDISSLNFNVNGPVTKLSDIGMNLFGDVSSSNEVLASSAVLMALAKNATTVVLNIVLFVLLFWLTKWVFWPLWAIIARNTIDKEEIKRKKAEKKRRKEKQPQGEPSPEVLSSVSSKYRGWGAIFGILTGLLICIATFMPLIGINKIYREVNASITVKDADDNEVPYLSTMIDDEILGYINCFGDSIGYKILEYSGAELTSSFVFDSLTSLNINDSNVNFSNEITNGLKIYKQAKVIMDFDKDNATKESIDDVLSAIKEVFIILDKSDFVYLIGDELLPVLIDNYAENVDIFDDEINDIVISSAQAHKNIGLKALQSQIESMIEVVTELNSRNLILPIMNGEIDKDFVLDVLPDRISSTEKFASTIIDNLFDISVISDKYGELVDKGVEKLFESLEINYTTQNTDNAKLKQNLKTVIKNLIETLKYYKASENLDFKNNTVKVARSLGEILDCFKGGFLSEDNYQSIIDLGKDKLNEVVPNDIDLSAVINSLSNVENWQSELTSLAKLYSSVIDFYNSNISFEAVMDEENLKFEEIGIGFDNAIAGSSIITPENARSVIENLLNTMNTAEFEDILDVEVESGLTLKNYVLNNIYNTTTERTSITSWENEFKYTYAVLRSIYNVLGDNFNVEELSKEENTTFENLGEAIDSAISHNTKLFVSNKVLRGLIDGLIDKFNVLDNEFAQDIFNATYDSLNEISVYDAILNNIYNPAYSSTALASAVSSWKDELLIAKKLINIDIDMDHDDYLVQFGGVLDDICGNKSSSESEEYLGEESEQTSTETIGSKIINKSIINAVVSHFIDDQTSTLNAGLTTGDNSAISTLKRNLNLVESYEREFGFIQDIANILKTNYSTADPDDDELTPMFKDFGNVFDKVMGKPYEYLDENNDLQVGQLEPSKIFSTIVVNKFLEYYFDDYVNNNLNGTDDQ